MYATRAGTGTRPFGVSRAGNTAEHAHDRAYTLL